MSQATKPHTQLYISAITRVAGLTPEAWRHFIYASVRKSSAVAAVWEWKHGYLWDILAYAELIPSGPGHSRNNYRWIKGENTVYRSKAVVCLGCGAVVINPLQGERWLVQGCGWCETFPVAPTRASIWNTVQYWYAPRQEELLTQLRPSYWD